jgi:hypothetical protein
MGSGSGSGRPKNIRIPRIWFRICNTAYYTLCYVETLILNLRNKIYKIPYTLQIISSIFDDQIIPEVIDIPPRYPLDLTYKTIRTFPGMRLTAGETRYI